MSTNGKSIRGKIIANKTQVASFFCVDFEMKRLKAKGLKAGRGYRKRKNKLKKKNMNKKVVLEYNFVSLNLSFIHFFMVRTSSHFCIFFFISFLCFITI